MNKTVLKTNVAGMVEEIFKASPGHVTGTIVVIAATISTIIWECIKYDGPNLLNVISATLVAGLISWVCFSVMLAAFSRLIGFVVASEKFKPKDQKAIRQYGSAEWLIVFVIVVTIITKGIPLLFRVMLNPGDLAILKNIGIL